MQTTSTPVATAIAAERRAAVKETLARIRAAAGHAAMPDAAAIDTIKHATQALAAKSWLWALQDFPIAKDQLWGVYEVSEDPDGRFAVYASAARPGHSQPPHNHTTWACIAGVSGIELNRFFRRIDAGGVPGPAQVEQIDERNLGPGDVCFLGPEEIHTIEILPPYDAMHLHLYGLGFPRLTHRVRYDQHTQTCDYFPLFSNIPRI